MCILAPAGHADTPPATPAAPAQRLDSQQRQQLARDALNGQAVSQLAQQFDVSRKFVYQQVAKADQALDQAFAPQGPDDDQVLFHLPVTKAWLQQLVLGLVLIGHSSYRGVMELLRDLFDCSLALGTVHNIVYAAVARARPHDAHQDLSNVRIGAHDELFQNGRPVLVGADVASTYCYLLSLEEQRDGDTWAVRLLELQDRGFQPDATIADAGSGLRAGQRLALPGVPCRGDVFHALQEVTPLVRYLDNRAYDAIGTRTDLERKIAKARRQGRATQQLTRQLHGAGPAETQAVAVAEDVTLLARWLREDILTVAGPDYASRCALYDFVVAELRAREPLCPHRIGPVVRLLTNQRDDLLAFAAQLDVDLAALAEEFQVPVATVRDLLNTQALNPYDPRQGPQEAALRQHLRGRFYALSEAVAALAGSTVRASSVIENFNSRLRGYFFLRRHLGPDYLVLLQFFLNHRRFLRSEHAERVDKSPTELLTGLAHPHWLEMLGYQRFARS